MKQSTELQELEASAPLEEAKMTISGNGKMFALIFNNIYPNIVKAATRELIANAWDAMVAAGNIETHPIEVHIPNTFEPWFSVRDYGVSMDHKFMMTRYTDAGDSTKDESDDFAGMFGIGRLTPLGITNVYTVQCWQNGKTRIYDVKRGKTGEPSVSFQYEGDSDEADGVLVQVSVDKDRFASFKDNAIEVINGLDTPVKLNGKDYERLVRKASYSGENWKFYANGGNGLRIRMGCISYPVRSEFFPDTPTIRQIVRDLGYFVNQDVLIDFKIGTFGVTGSREDIKYDEEGVLKILNALNDIKAVIADEAKKSLATIRGRTEFEYAAMDVSRQLSFLGTIHFEWKGKTFSYSNGHTFSKHARGVKFDAAKYPMAQVYHYYGERVRPEWNNTRKEGYINRQMIPRIFIVDPKRTTKLIPRLIEWKNQNPIDNESSYLYLFQAEDTTKLSFMKIMAALGYPEIVRIEDVNPYVREKVERVKNAPLEMRLFTRFSRADGGRQVVDDTKPLYYFVRNYSTWDIESTGISTDFARSYIKENMKDESIYVLTSGEAEWLAKKLPNLKMVSMIEKITEYLNKIKPDAAIVENIAINELFMTQWRKKEFFEWVGFIPENFKPHEFKNSTSQNFYTAGLGREAIDLKVVELQTKLDEFYSKYPILKYIDSYYSSTPKEEVLAYIEMVNKMENS